MRLFDSEELNIPNLNQRELDLVLRLAKDGRIVRFDAYADVIQGEINLAGDAEHISTAPGKHKIFRGAQVLRYRVAETLSQGEPLFLDKNRYLAGERATSKAFAFQHSRVAFQRNTGVDDARRIHAALLQQGFFTADSLNFLSVTSRDISTNFLLAILNSTISEWRFRLSSTNNHVNAYEIERLPVPRITMSAPYPERDQVVEKAIELFERNEYAAVMHWVVEELGWSPDRGLSSSGRSDTVHDLLAQLAERMTNLHKERAEIEQAWREWVETVVPKADNLSGEFLNGGWVEAGCQNGWDDVKAVFQGQDAVPSAKRLQDLQRETETALDKLCPLHERIGATDHLIDQITYRLYGLTEEDISVVEDNVKGA